MAHTFNSHITIHETLTAVVRQRMVERELAKSGHEMPIHVRAKTPPYVCLPVLINIGTAERLYYLGYG